MLAAVHRWSCSKRLEEARLSVPALETVVSFTVVAPEGSADSILQAMSRLVASLDPVLDYRGRNGLGELNRAGRGVPEGDLRLLLVQAFMLRDATGGAFEPCILPLVGLWGFHDEPRVPSSAEIDSARALCGPRCCRMAGDTLVLSPGSGIDLGAVAAGFAADRAFDLAMESGAVAALVDAGGEIRCGGDREWRIAIRHPREDGFWDVLEVSDCGVSTSGDYESFVMSDGARFCHILDPSTGMPESGVASVTVVAGNCTVADGLSTALAVGGPDLLEIVPESLWTGVLFVLETDSGLVERRFGVL
ncbi:FAD:protein FMN transferase [Candidatus Fermentibacteria bacterium]|nr:FAD:protein FMN transferase [Candidatus Fermentibacteria bacterium]